MSRAVHTTAAARRTGIAVVWAVSLVGAGFILLPIVFMIGAALKSDRAVLSVPVRLVPTDPKFGNFGTATRLIPFWREMANSALVAGVGSVGTVLSSAMAAYPLARLRVRGMRVVFAMILLTILLPSQVLLVSQFLIFKRLGWYGTYLPLIIPSWLGGGTFNIFLLRQYFLTLPRELEQAAMIDGAGPLRTFFQVILPEAVPALVAVGILDFVSKWNDFLGPLIYLDKTSTYTLPLGLATFQGIYNTAWNYLMADTLLAVIPCVVLFAVAQRLVVRGFVVSPAPR